MAPLFDYVIDIDNDVLAESIISGYNAIYEYINGNGDIFEKRLSKQLTDEQINALCAMHKINNDKAGMPYDRNKDIAAMKANPAKYYPQLKFIGKKMSTNYNTVMNSVTQSEKQHDIRGEYYNAVLSYMASTYKKYGIPFNKDKTLSDIMAQDFDQNQQGAFNGFRINFHPKPINSVSDVMANPLITKMRYLVPLFGGIVVRWVRAMNTINKYLSSNDLDGLRSFISKFNSENEKYQAKRQEKSDNANNDSNTIQVPWQHLGEILDTHIGIEKSLRNDDFIDLSNYAPHGEADIMQGKLNELAHAFPRQGECFGEFFARMCMDIDNHIFIKPKFALPSTKEKRIEPLKAIYVKSVGPDALKNYPDSGSSYVDYLSSAMPNPTETWKDFAFRLYYDSMAAFGNIAFGEIADGMGKVAAKNLMQSNDMHKNDISPCTRPVLTDWIMLLRRRGNPMPRKGFEEILSYITALKNS